MKRIRQRALAHIFADSFGWQIRCKCCGYSTNVEAANGDGFQAAAKAFYGHIGTEWEADRHLSFALGHQVDAPSHPGLSSTPEGGVQ